MSEVSQIRNEFPALNQQVRGQNLVYLDSANTTLKPQSVIDRIQQFYKLETANVHRGSHFLSDRTTGYYEQARENIRAFLGAASTEEIIFTKGTTEGINLIAASFGSLLNEGDEVVLTELEHHANIVPWQTICNQKKCVLKYIKVNSLGEIDLTSIDETITSKTRMVSFSGCSNILGTLTPISTIVSKAKSVGALTLLDAAQLVSQTSIDVCKLNVDFLVFSSHKLFGPYGFGVVYGKKALLEKMPPYQTGGSMISEVNYEHTTFNTLPLKFEAGTPHIEGAIGLSAAIDFFKSLNIVKVFEHEQKLMRIIHTEFNNTDDVKIFGQSANKAAIVSFTVDGAHHSDLGQILDQLGIAVRVGHHCTQPLLKKFGLTGTVRASISLYNDESDVDKFLSAVKMAKRMLK